VSELVSTIRIDDLYATACPQDVRQELSWRGVRMVHMLIDQKLKNNCETYYCPDTAMRIGRISEINKYSPFLNNSLSGAFITLEIPASPGEDIWAVEDAALLEDCLKELTRTKITPKKALALKAFYTRLDKTYPIYLLGWEKDFDHIYSKINRIENLYTLGRNGLFLHCNIDHCIEQGMALAEHIFSENKKYKKHWNTKVENFLSVGARD
jgi:protoporphyrinogen oxidase